MEAVDELMRRACVMVAARRNHQRAGGDTLLSSSGRGYCASP